MPLREGTLHAPPCLWQRTGLCGLGYCVPLCQRRGADRLGLSPAWSPHEAAAEEIEACAAKHLALQHFEAIDMPLDRPGAPGQRDARFDRLIVVAESARK